MTEAIIISFAVIALLVIINYGYLLLQFTRIWKIKNNKIYPPLNKNFNTKVSIVVAMRNEEETIEKCLQSLIHQNYPSDLYEIIIANDASTDQSAEIVKKYQSNYPDYKIQLIDIIDILNNTTPKKRALDIAIRASHGNLILTCDADSEAGENWISSIVDEYEKSNCKMICGPVKIKEELKAGWIHEFQRLDCMALLASSGAALEMNKALMCNGSNLAFEKEAYLTISDEIKGKNIASGDDVFLMLTMQEKFNKGLIFIFRKDSMVITRAQKNLKALFSQRKRWASKNRFYDNNYILFVSTLVVLINLFLLISGIVSFINSKFFILFLSLFLSKTSFDFLLIRTYGEFYGEKVKYLKLLFLELFYPLLIAGLMIGSFSKSYHWKNRKLN